MRLLALDTLGCGLAAAWYDFGRAARATAGESLSTAPNLRGLMESLTL